MIEAHTFESKCLSRTSIAEEEKEEQKAEEAEEEGEDKAEKEAEGENNAFKLTS